MFYLENADGETEGFIGIIRDISGKQDRITQLQVIDRVLRHNFKKDLNIIQGFAEQIQRWGTPPLAEHAITIREASTKLMETVKREREATNFLSNTPTVTTVDLSAIVNRVGGHLSNDYPAANISPNTPGERLVEATERIERALEELVINSILHSDAENPQRDGRCGVRWRVFSRRGH